MYKSNQEVAKNHLYKDFKDFPNITDEVRRINSQRAFTGSVRISNEMYRTSSETSQYIENSLKRKLPWFLENFYRCKRLGLN